MDIAAVSALEAKATRSELSGDLDTAFKLYLQATQSYLHISRTEPPGLVRDGAKASASKCLERAQKIKAVKRDNLTPVRRDRFSQESQALITEQSSRINEEKYPRWSESSTKPQPGASRLSNDFLIQSASEIPSITSWKRPSDIMPTTRVFSPSLQPHHLAQELMADCSVIASLVVCLDHHKRFDSRLGLSRLYPQGPDGLPCWSEHGIYSACFRVNGIDRQILIDDILPVTDDGKLACASTKDQAHLWPALMEKAYMTLNAGYDFPGSNSAIDLYTMTGWIPEHIPIHSATFRSEKCWERLKAGFAQGHCVLTIGTDMESPLTQYLGMVPNHDYAVVGIRETEHAHRILRLLNPWGTTPDTLSEERVSDHMRGLNIADDAECKVDEDDGAIELEWEVACAVCEGIYVNWDPKTLTREAPTIFHGMWSAKANEVDDLNGSERIINHHFKLRRATSTNILSSFSSNDSIWCLLSRHMKARHETSHYIALHAFNALDASTANTGRKDQEDWDARQSRKDAYSNSPHVLTRIPVRDLEEPMSLIASWHDASEPNQSVPTKVEVCYTLSIFSPIGLVLEDVPERLLYVKEIRDSLTTKNSGGNSTHPTFMNNPQYTLTIHPTSTAVRVSQTGTRSEEVNVRLNLNASKDVAINVKAVWGANGRVTEIIRGDVVLDTGAYNYGLSFGSAKLRPGSYTLILSTFDPGVQSPYTLSVECDSRFDIENIPGEGAGMFSRVVKGCWFGSNAAGPPSSGSYTSNPAFRVSVPMKTQMIFRLQLASPRTRIPINATLFEYTSSGPGTQILTTGGYNDALCGVVTARQTVIKGEYVMYCSTHRSGVEGDFVLMSYSSATAVKVQRL